jgi:hypothetical protein
MRQYSPATAALMLRTTTRCLVQRLVDCCLAGEQSLGDQDLASQEFWFGTIPALPAVVVARWRRRSCSRSQSSSVDTAVLLSALSLVAHSGRRASGWIVGRSRRRAVGSYVRCSGNTRSHERAPGARQSQSEGSGIDGRRITRGPAGYVGLRRSHPGGNGVCRSHSSGCCPATCRGGT